MLMKKLNVIIEVPIEQVAVRTSQGFVPYDLAAAKRRRYEMQMLAIKDGATDVIAYEKIEIPEEEVAPTPKKSIAKKIKLK